MPTITLQPGQSCMCAVQQLLEYDFHIPMFQRPYDWGAEQVQDMIGDLAEAQSRQGSLFLGLTVVCPSGANRYAIVDGQQRLTTLMLALAARSGTQHALRAPDGMLSAPWISPRPADVGFMRALLARTTEKPGTLSQRRLHDAFAQLCDASGFTLDTILRAQLIVYVAPNLAGATGLFERINLRGKEVSQFDLVKNKLIEWTAMVPTPTARDKVEAFITERYDRLYRLLDPGSSSTPFDSDKLLKLHWILFSDKVFKPGQRVLARLDETLSEVHDQQGNIVQWIEQYIDSLVEVAEAWVKTERPYEDAVSRSEKKLRDALLGFARLGRETELQPLIVAAIVRWGTGATDLIRFCEIVSFRGALAKQKSHSERSRKWRFARQLYQGDWVDGKGAKISAASAAIHQLFWGTASWWNEAEAEALGQPMSAEERNTMIVPENALDSPKFYQEYKHIIHYLFWNYGLHLPRSEKWSGQVREDISPFQESVWFENDDSFQNWDIEHIYPQNPDDRHTKDGKNQFKAMAPWLHHLGNLTVLPIRDNRGMQNAPFESKLDWLRQQRKVSFNELLSSAEYRGNLMSRPHWGDNNCRKRVARLKEAADDIWGLSAIKRLGVGKYDARVQEPTEDDDDMDDQS